jgi:hypothetical protein
LEENLQVMTKGAETNLSLVQLGWMGVKGDLLKKGIENGLFWVYSETRVE